MPIFKSKHPDITVPDDITIWEWLFGDDSPYSPLNKWPEEQLAGYTDGATKERLSWHEVKEAAVHISTALVERYGLRPGQTVSLFSRNTIWYPVTLFAAMRVGGVVSGASPAYNVDEMTYALRTADARFIATHPTSIGVARQAARNVGIPKSHIFLLEGELDGYTTVRDLIRLGRGESREAGGEGWQRQTPAFALPGGKTNREVCALLSFSSGTTGLPKAVMIAHSNVIAQAMQIEPLTPADHKKVLGVLPMFHITGIVHSMHLPVAINAEVIMLPAFTMESMLDAIVEYQIKELLLVPPILIRLVRDPIVDRYDLSCVTRISSGAAPVSPEILELLQRRFPGSGFKQGYGMTESCSCITAHPPWAYDYRNAHTVGTIVANTEVKLLRAHDDDDDEDSRGGEEEVLADVGEPGEILARGPQVVMGYLGNAAATRATFDADGWLHTGDQGVMDARGFLAVTDRIKELIKVKGVGVAPAELEDLLLGHPAVEDCAVLAVPDDRAGERPKAYVVPSTTKAKTGLTGGSTAGGDGSGADDDDRLRAAGLDIIAYVERRKARDKWVKEVEFVDEIPKSASGKILRRVLRDRAKKGPVGVVVRAQDGRPKL
ncbi:acetyl-CoA synthetase-like protein [Xylariaceae sp. FL0804]|nr:acetyl-CoA synthetase-like protein [Xylariaceae sp. FL0804]